MDYSIIRYIIGWVIFLEGIFMYLPLATALVYREDQGFVYFGVGTVCIFLGKWIISRKPANQTYFAREGFVIVALSWIVMSAIGSIPFILTQEIPNFVDAMFETTSGFTTTGASILKDVEALSHASLMWRSFTHWIGGMGVFVLLLAILPLAGGYNIHLMRAESPGPVVGKLVPRIKDTAKILYLIYLGMTLLELILLLMAGMPLFDSLCTAFGTAGTGGFAIKNDSMGGYSPLMLVIVTVFMILFGVNFNAYYALLLGKNKKAIFKMEEVRWYFAIIFLAIAVITFNILPSFENLGQALLHAAFQVGSIITTTGFSSVDFNVWPQLSRVILVLLMICGACAGSTGGGLKVSRLVVLFKSVKKEIGHFIHPRGVKIIKMDGKALERSTVHSISSFLILYVFIFTASVLLLALDNLDMTTTFTAVAATFNNIGPGLNVVGPAGNFSDLSYLSKSILIFDMLAGRLELYPILILFIPSVWKKNC